MALNMTPDDLTPADRIQAQDKLMQLWVYRHVKSYEPERRHPQKVKSRGNGWPQAWRAHAVPAALRPDMEPSRAKRPNAGNGNYGNTSGHNRTPATVQRHAWPRGPQRHDAGRIEKETTL